jgi:hypothetical protein
MLRSAILWGLFLLLGAAVLSDAAPLSRAEDQRAESLAAKLQRASQLPPLDDKNTTLQEVLDLVSDRHDITIDVNDVAFKVDGVNDVASSPLVQEKPLHIKKNARLEHALRLILARVPVDATFLLRRNSIEITTVAAAGREIWGKDYQGPYLPLVHNTFEKQPLEKVLRDLADESEFTIVLDGRVEDKAKVAVSGRFLNTPLDTAVRLLADMADLKPFLVDNVLYVTSKENAALLEEQELKKVKQAQEMGTDAPAPRVGAGRFVRPMQPAGM